MKTWRQAGIVFFQIGIFMIGGIVRAEDIQVSTYNTSPYGSYKELTTTGNAYLATLGGGVGVGTGAVAGAALNVAGTMKIVDPLASSGPGYALTSVDNTGTAAWKIAPWYGNLNGGTGVPNDLVYWASNSTLDNVTSIDENMGKIAVGALFPNAPLSVSGRGAIHSTIYADDTLATIQYGIYANATDPESYGAYGTAAGTSTANAGGILIGYSYGIYGSGNTTGIFGKATGVAGWGVRGEGVVGVEGVATMGDGVYGYSNSASGYGVYGKNIDAAGYGVVCEGGKCGGDKGWNCPSDGRLKTDIATISDPLGKLQALRGILFEWKQHPGKHEFGLSAQEVAKVFPEAVEKSPAGYYTLRLSSLNGFLAEVIKQQQKEIDSLKNEIGKLEVARKRGMRS